MLLSVLLCIFLKSRVFLKLQDTEDTCLLRGIEKRKKPLYRGGAKCPKCPVLVFFSDIKCLERSGRSNAKKASCSAKKPEKGWMIKNIDFFTRCVIMGVLSINSMGGVYERREERKNSRGD